ncbi:hypothetical protein ABB02_01668 [Clostridiaceae bacterium JG1575]|nr:hypothetical protein ABB02_01668 [Clostridiaceae bacterium JG1575]
MSNLTAKTASLELIYVKEKSPAGKESLERRRFPNIKGTALPEDIHAVAKALAAISLGQFKAFELTQASVLDGE